MSSTKLIQMQGAGQADPPPMGELLALLRSHGFPVTTDDYVSLLKIVEHFGHEGLDGLGARICPIIATSPEEQARFYKVFDVYKASQHVTAAPVKPGGRRRWLVAAGSALLIAAAIFFINQWQDSHLKAIGLPLPSGDTLSLAQGDTWRPDLVRDGLFDGRWDDTAVVTVSWDDVGRGRLGRGFRLAHRFQEPGLHLIRRSLSSAKLPVNRPADTIAIFVCPALARLIIESPPERVRAGEAFQLRAATSADPGDYAGYEWCIQHADGDMQCHRTETGTLNHTYDSAGMYRISCRLVATAGHLHCATGDTVSVMVADTGSVYTLGFSGDNQQLAVSTSLKWWPGLLILLLAGATAVAAFMPWKGNAAPPPEASTQIPPAGAGQRGPPYEVPFPKVSAADIIMDKPLRRFIQQLRYKAEEECTELHVQKTIGATIRAGGLTDLVFTPRKKAQDFLLFIDNAAPAGMVCQLFSWLVDSMEAECVPLIRFYYNPDFICYSPEFPAGTTLRNIADNYPTAIPIVFGDGAALLDKIAPVVKSALLSEWVRWEVCLLVTPKPAGDWGTREQTLGRHFLMAPADATALEALGLQLRSHTALRDGGKLHAFAGPPEAEAEAMDVDELRAYLGHDEALFQWLCALCIYPKPRWELVIPIGRAVLGRMGRTADLRYDVLLRLCRISWMASGSFPQRLRMELLKVLTVDNELAARGALVELMAEVDMAYSGEALFRAEQRLQDTISRFVLYAHDPLRHAADASVAERFGELFKSGKLTDVPAKKYLDMPKDGSWPTPIGANQVSVSITNYFKAADLLQAEAERKLRNQRVRRRLAGAGGLILLGGLWSAMFFGHIGQSHPQMSRLYTTDPDQMVQLRYRLVKDFSGCGDSSGTFSVIPGTLNLDNQAYPLQFDAATQTLSANVPYSLMRQHGESASIMLGIGGSYAPTAYPQRLSSGGVITATCSNSEDPAKPGTLPDALNEIWQGAANGRLININLDRRIIYYSTGGAETYGSYRIDTVIAMHDIFRVVSGSDGGYRVFIIAKITDESFGLIACQERYPRLADALKVSETCGPYDQMTHYYPTTRRGHIFLPVAPRDGSTKPLEQSEARKLYTQAAEAVAKFSQSRIAYRLYNNPSYLRSYVNYDLGEVLARLDLKGTSPMAEAVSKGRAPANPFQREYLQVEFTAPSGYVSANVPNHTRELRDSMRGAARDASTADQSSLQQAKRLMNAGDLNAALSLYLKLQKSSDRQIAKEAKQRLDEIRKLQAAQQPNQNVLPQTPKEDPAVLKQREEEAEKQRQKDAAEKQRQDDEAEKRRYDSLMNSNVPKQKSRK